MKQQIERLIDQLACKEQPIFIGDVLEKMKEQKVYDVTMWTKVLFNWSECGFAKSLQEIYAECEWNSVLLTGSGGRQFGKKLAIKPSPHKDLFQFLLNLNLI